MKDKKDDKTKDRAWVKDHTHTEQEFFDWLEHKGIIVRSGDRAVLTHLGTQFARLLSDGRGYLAKEPPQEKTDDV